MARHGLRHVRSVDPDACRVHVVSERARSGEKARRPVPPAWGRPRPLLGQLPEPLLPSPLVDEDGSVDSYFFNLIKLIYFWGEGTLG